ncbi:betaine/carnitine transporter, BCCT family, partial [Dethiosulfatibacter aminovorans DSM 17477]
MTEIKKEVVNDIGNKEVEIDKIVFWSSLTVILAICLSCIIFPEGANEAASVAREWVIMRWDWLFLLFGIASLLGSLYIAFSKYGHVKLGGKDEKPEFKFSSWLAMIFFSAIGSSSILWAVCEPMAYLQSPPFGYEPFSLEAYNISLAYGMFHWGPIAWAFYALPALPVAYYFIVKKQNNLKLSQVCSDLIGQKNADGLLGKVIDIFTIFATFGGNGPGLGFGVPLLATLICAVFGLTRSPILDMFVLIIWATIFSVSVYRGLDKGIKILSDINMVLIIVLLVFVFLVGSPLFILQNSVEAVGTLATNFIKMSTYTDTIGGSGFGQWWTVFYWAWWVALAPFMVIFVARISRGRTIKELLLGIIGAGSAG